MKESSRVLFGLFLLVLLVLLNRYINSYIAKHPTSKIAVVMYRVNVFFTFCILCLYAYDILQDMRFTVKNNYMFFR